jgi:hypothetical protein
MFDSWQILAVTVDRPSVRRAGGTGSPVAGLPRADVADLWWRRGTRAGWVVAEERPAYRRDPAAEAADPAGVAEVVGVAGAAAQVRAALAVLEQAAARAGRLAGADPLVAEVVGEAQQRLAVLPGGSTTPGGTGAPADACDPPAGHATPAGHAIPTGDPTPAGDATPAGHAPAGDAPAVDATPAGHAPAGDAAPTGHATPAATLAAAVPVDGAAWPEDLAGAIAGLDLAVTTLTAAPTAPQTDADLLDRAADLQRVVNRLDAAVLGLLATIDARQAYTARAFLTLASWWRTVTNSDHGHASRVANAALRLRRLPAVAAALADGCITLAHATAITHAAIPRRIAAIAQVDQTLARLAREVRPQDVRRVLGTIADHVDPDGTPQPEPHTDLDPDPDPDPDPGCGGHGDGGDSEEPPACGQHGHLDERRELSWHRGLDHLVELRATLDQLTAEKLATVIDVLTHPDAPDTPDDCRRSAAQRRHDALDHALDLLLSQRDDNGRLPTVHGYPAQVALVVDLATALGLDDLADRSPRLRFTGDTTTDLARRILHHASVQALISMGPWRITSVGDRMRTLPPWLRTALEAIHPHCPGPGCDRPFTWTDAHHTDPWADSHTTDLASHLPPCRGHHTLITVNGWDARFDCADEVYRWTGPEGQTVEVPPPRRRALRLRDYERPPPSQEPDPGG